MDFCSREMETFSGYPLIKVVETNLVGFQKVGIVVGERSQVLLVLAAVRDVLLEDLPPVDGRRPAMAPLETRALMGRRSSPEKREREKESVSTPSRIDFASTEETCLFA